MRGCTFPCLVRSVVAAGEARYALGDPLVDGYLEFVAGRARPNTLRAMRVRSEDVLHVVDKDPVEVEAADVFEFLRAAARRPRRWCGSPIASRGCRRARSPAGCRRCRASTRIWSPAATRRSTANPVPRGLSTAAARRPRPARCRWCGCRARCRRSSSPAEVDALLGGAAHGPGPGDGAGDAARRAAPLRGPRSASRRYLGRRTGRCSSPRARAAINGWCRSSNPFFAAVGDYLHDERPAGCDTDRVFVVLKGPTPRPAADRRRRRRDPRRRPRTRRARARARVISCATPA